MTTTPAGEHDTADAVLDFAAGELLVRRRAEANTLIAACAWADLHPASEAGLGSTMIEAYGDTGLTLAGPGAPEVSEFAIPEFALRIGLAPETGKRYVGEALELRHRLPRLWERVQALEVEAWRARRIAQATITHELSLEAAGFVDSQLAPVAHSVGPSQLDRVVDEAITRLMPTEDERRAQAEVERRHFTVDRDQVSFDGHVDCHGTLDLADAMTLDAAVREETQRLRDLGAEEAAGPLSAQALVGLVCRTDQPLDLPGASSSGGSTPPPQRRRTVVLHLHLADSAVHGARTAPGSGLEVGRVEETRAPVTADQVRAWCGADATTDIVIQPVRDLADHIHTGRYEIPDRLQAQVRDLAHTCVFPLCTRPAQRCDLDHVAPYNHTDLDAGGSTCSCNLAPLCRAHHRLKTHACGTYARWTYSPLAPGTWLWRSPHGHHYLRDHRGTTPWDGDPPPLE